MYFDKVRDFKMEGRCLYRLDDILGSVLCGTIAHCGDFTEVADYGEDNLSFLQAAELGLSFLPGIPSEDTLGRAVYYLNSNELGESFKACLQGIALKRAPSPSDPVAIGLHF